MDVNEKIIERQKRRKGWHPFVRVCIAVFLISASNLENDQETWMIIVNSIFGMSGVLILMWMADELRGYRDAYFYLMRELDKLKEELEKEKKKKK